MRSQTNNHLMHGFWDGSSFLKLWSEANEKARALGRIHVPLKYSYF